eukprot:scaffold342372_cov35-Attheya_sp.AAC.1
MKFYNENTPNLSSKTHKQYNIMSSAAAVLWLSLFFKGGGPQLLLRFKEVNQIYPFNPTP